MKDDVNAQWQLASRPNGPVTEQNFRYAEASIPTPKDGEILVKNLYIAFEPAMRGWINDRPTYRQPVQVGAVMDAITTGEVVESRSSAYAKGDIVVGAGGWQRYYVPGPKDMLPASKVPPGVPLTAPLGVFGITGLTAYFGMLDVAKPKAGETVVVSGAAGATGSVAAQIGKIRECRVIGIAGGGEKCDWLTKTAGLDEAIDYKNESVPERLRELCPKGIDVYFDNVGGAILDAALANLAMGARIALCGGISAYNAAPGSAPGLQNHMALVLRRSRMEGFLVFDYAARYPEAVAELAGWVQQGRIKTSEDVAEGFENAPRTFLRLFTGENLGKQLLKL